MHMTTQKWNAVWSRWLGGWEMHILKFHRGLEFANLNEHHWYSKAHNHFETDKPHIRCVRQHVCPIQQRGRHTQETWQIFWKVAKRMIRKERNIVGDSYFKNEWIEGVYSKKNKEHEIGERIIKEHEETTKKMRIMIDQEWTSMVNAKKLKIPWQSKPM